MKFTGIKICGRNRHYIDSKDEKLLYPLLTDDNTADENLDKLNSLLISVNHTNACSVKHVSVMYE